MSWKKMGLIYCPHGQHGWDMHSATTPTPILLHDNTLRVYAGFRDPSGVSRISYVDLQADNPSIIIRASHKPVLDIGIPGAFDDNGVILGDLVAYEQALYMYYVGFQLVNRVKFLAFTGLAISLDGGESFHRHQQVPVMDRSDEGLYIRAIHTVLHEGHVFRTWYAAGSGWEIIQGAPYPQYSIHYTESSDGITFGAKGTVCISPNRDNQEYRIGRPRVYKVGGGYVMYFTYGTVSGEYMCGYAESTDGVHWDRRDSAVGISLSSAGWDSTHLCYPALITVGQSTYMFYNGNNMGQTGFGYAVLEAS